jgi:hypothetical protein
LITTFVACPVRNSSIPSAARSRASVSLMMGSRFSVPDSTSRIAWGNVKFVM